MGQTRAVNFTNVQSNRRVTFSHGQMDKTHLMEEVVVDHQEEEVAVADLHQLLEAVSGIHHETVVTMRVMVDRVGL